MTDQSRRLILASSSKPRQALLKRLQIPFEIAHPNTDETPLANETPKDLVTRLAEQKARDVAKQYPDAIIIGADQVGVIDQQIMGKPHTHDNAVKQLQTASGKCMQYFIGLCVLDAKTQQHETVLETFDVIFRDLTPAMIENYLQKEHVLHCAGSFKAEGLAVALVKEFRGADINALIGLPLVRLVSMLEKVGIHTL